MRLVQKAIREVGRLFRGSKRGTHRVDAPHSKSARRAEACPVDERQLLTAILLPVCGRNGSTLCMQLLGTSPEIAFERVYPFEHRYLTYLWRVADVMQREFDPHPLWNNGLMVHPERHEEVVYVGPIPWGGRKLISHPRASVPFDQRCLQALWREFTATVREQALLTLPGEPAPRFYAEKSTPGTLEALGVSVPTKSIYLVRDPRDIWISVNRFDARRGYFGFGRGTDESEQDYLSRFLETRASEMQLLQSIRDDDRRLVVQYERLASDLPSEASRIGDWLGVRLHPEQVEQQRDSFQHHITSGTAENSVTRWKRELPADVNRQFVARLESELTHFGYDAA